MIPDSAWLRSELISSWRRIFGTIVLLIGPGIIFGLIDGLTRKPSVVIAQMLRDRHLIFNGALEASLLGLFLLVLRARGWKPSDLRIGMGWLSSLSGLGLLLATYLGVCLAIMPLYLLTRVLAGTVWGHRMFSFVPHPLHLSHGSIHLSWVVIIAFTCLNAFFEEAVYMSFAFNQCAAKAGPAMAVLATVLLRISVHTYQGTEHLLQIGALSLIFSLWYWWSGKVWPLILAHAVIDLVSLGLLKMRFG